MYVPPRYKDFWIKIIGSLLGSQLIDALNRQESYFQRLTTRYFYTDLLGGFLIALLLWEIVRRITIYLDKRYDWMEMPVQRLLLQFVLGIVLPSFFSFLLTLGFMRVAYDQDIFQTNWIYNEFYAVILIIVLVNLVYFTWWLFLQRQHTAVPITEIANPPGLQTGMPEFAGGNPGASIEVDKAGKTLLLSHEQIAYVYLNENYCYIKSWDGNSYVTTYTLDEVHRALTGSPFFRANRQVLVSRKACMAYQSIDNGKVALELNPAFKHPVVVSQKRAKNFRKWITGHNGTGPGMADASVNPM